MIKKKNHIQGKCSTCYNVNINGANLYNIQSCTHLEDSRTKMYNYSTLHWRESEIAEVKRWIRDIVNKRADYDRFNKRFNTIPIQGTPQMAVNKEYICLSRVYSY